MLKAARPEAVAEALKWACRLDVYVAKPGNVSLASPGHGMLADDFLASAEAVAGPLSAPGRKVGERIGKAVAATWSRVGMNTNLGIVLLAAPLAQAALSLGLGESLESATERVLAELDSDDAAQAFGAIVRANPAGLGEAERLDVREPPSVSLREAMREAAHRDSIALQYANGYREVFGFGMPCFRSARDRFESDERATFRMCSSMSYLSAMSWNMRPSQSLATVAIRSGSIPSLEQQKAAVTALPPKDTA